MAKTATTATRRKPLYRATNVQIPGEFERRRALQNLSTNELKDLLRAATLPIPKMKAEMMERLAAAGNLVTVTVTVEAAVFGPDSGPWRCR